MVHEIYTIDETEPLMAHEIYTIDETEPQP